MSEMGEIENIAEKGRQKRVQTLKKTIIVSLIIVILLPILCCVVLFVRINHLEKQLHELQTQREKQLEVKQAVGAQDTEENLEEIDKEKNLQKAIEKDEETKESEDTMKVYLTFDDGPSSNTDKILDVLAQYNVRATFFVVGKEQEEYQNLYKRIIEEGHTIGMHSYSHIYDEIYESVESFATDLVKLQEFIYDTTGTWSRYYRFPGGSSNTVSKSDMSEFTEYLEEQGIQYFDWNVSNLDAVGGRRSVNEIVHNVIKDVTAYKSSIVLMHDSQDKITTVEALPIIIEQLQEMGNVEILPITDDTALIHHISK